MSSGESVRLVDVPSVNNIIFSDTVFVTSSGVVSQATPNAVFSNVNLQVATLIVGNTSTPISSTMTVATGSMWYDANYLYIATSNNVIKRLSLELF